MHDIFHNINCIILILEIAYNEYDEFHENMPFEPNPAQLYFYLSNEATIS